MNNPKKEVVVGGLSKKNSLILSLKNRKQELLYYLEKLREYKAKTIKLAHNLESKYYNNEISKAEFLYKLNQSLKSKSLEEWISYYDKLISYYNNELINLDNEIKEVESNKFSSLGILITLMLIMLGLVSLIFFKPTITGFVILDNASIIFDRDLDCDGCGQHKVPSDAIVNITISAKFNGTTQNDLFIDYYPVSWNIIDANDGVIESYDSKWNKISWILNNDVNFIEKSYIVQAPAKTTPPTKYDFKSEFIIESKLWDVIVADPACVFTITLELPTNQVSVVQGNNFTAQGKVVCGGGGSRSSNNVDLRIRYNATTTAADTIIPTDLSVQLKSNESNFNCGTLTNSAGSDTCIHNWNVTGIQLGSVVIDAFTNTGTKDSADIQINITAAPTPNRASNVTQPAFNQTNYTDLNFINASLVVTDDDNDLVNVTFEWYKNDNNLVKRNDYLDIANGTNITDILNIWNVVGDDQIWVQAFAFDGELNSTLLNSTTITITKTETFDNTTIPAASTYTGYPEKTVDEIINETGITIPRSEISEINRINYSAEEVILTNGKKALVIHKPLINGTLFNNSVSLTEKDDFTYNSSFEDTRIEIEFDSKKIQQNSTRRNFTKSEGASLYAWKLGYDFLLPSQYFKPRFRISSSSPIEIIDNSSGIFKTGKYELDFTTEVNEGFSIEINQTHSNIIYVYLVKNFSEEGFKFDDPINIDPTLTVDGTIYEVCNEFSNYTQIEVINNGVLTVCARTASEGSGYANITLGANGNFSLSANSRIEGLGRGARGGAGCSANTCSADQGENGQNWSTGTASTNDNGGGGGGGRRVGNADSTGGGGGGFGGTGGTGGEEAADGVQPTGGQTYGSATGEVLFGGSGGGGEAGDATPGTGTAGGSGLRINASAGWITIYGIINMSGANGTDGDGTDNSGSGAGSGGHVILETRNFTLGSAAKIFADGGRGGNVASGTASCGGGGGGGGRILYIYTTGIISNTFQNFTLGGAKGFGANANCDAGSGAPEATAGTDGTVSHVSRTFPDVTNTAPNNPTSLVINSTNTAHTNLTTEDLRASFLCDDPDAADVLTFSLTAFKDKVNQFQLRGGCSDPEYKSVVLNAINTTKNDNWSFSVNVSDDDNAYSATISSVVNISILNTAPIIGNVTLDEADPISVVEGGNKTFRFSFIVTDADNQSDIVNASAVANITRTGETTRYNDTFVNPSDGGCRGVNNIGTNGINFSCTINVVFYDEAGLWNISVRINDSVKRTDIVDYAFAQNTTKTFTIAETTSIQLSTSTITFSTVIPNTNNISSLVNITIRNIGNDDISGREATGETINITAITLIGLQDSSTFIPVSNFTIGQANSTSGSATETGNYCAPSRVANVTRLQNTSAAAGFANFTGAINGSFVLAQAVGNVHSIGLCLIHAPDDLTSQDYSSSGSGSWSFIIFYFRRKKNEDEEEEDQIKSVIESFSNQNKVILDTLKKLIDKLIKEKPKISSQDIINLLGQKFVSTEIVPISIFDNKELSALEAIVKHLKENLSYNYAKIASLLNRDDRTIWATYQNAVKKRKTKLIVKDSKYVVPLLILSDRNFAVLELICEHLHDYYNLRNHDIAVLLNRDDRTIWATYQRIKKKRKR